MAGDDKQPTAAKSPQSRRQQYVRRHAAMKKDRSSWDSTMREIAEYIAPRRSRFFQSEATTSGRKKEQHIINSTAGWAARTTSAGMMASISSPAREWFGLTTSDPSLAEIAEVKQWLADSEERLRDGMARTNLYNALPTLYGDLTQMGTGVALVDSDDIDLARTYNIPVGSYCLATNERGIVDTLFYETTFSVRDMVRKFGREKCSQRVRDAYDEMKWEERIEVVHVVEPRDEYDADKSDPLNMPIASCWYEAAGDADAPLLAESGYQENPILAPRWSVCDNDVYGTGPGHEVLGDVKGLQFLERLKANAMELVVDPPMVGPDTMKIAGVGLLPGDVTFTKQAVGEQLIAAKEVRPEAVEVAEASIEKHEQRIARGLFADIWSMWSQQEEGQPITAAEVHAREQEKMLLLGPVDGRLETELLDVLIERFFGILFRAGRIDPPPQAVAGKPLRAVYRSIMVQAQKALAASGIQQLVTFGLSIAQAQPAALDKINIDEALSEYADAAGANPKVMNADDKVAQIRAARAQQQQQAMQAQQGMAASQAAKNLGGADTSGKNALTDLIGGVPAAEAGGSVQ